LETYYQNKVVSSSQKRQNLPARIRLCAQHQPCSENSPPKNVQHTVETRLGFWLFTWNKSCNPEFVQLPSW